MEPVTEPPPAGQRVVIAEDSVLLLAGLTKLLESAGFEVVATAGDAEGLLAAVERERPDVVVADVRMPPTHTDEGIRAALVIRSQWPEIAVLVLSQYVEERYAADLLSSHTHGVGYLLKDRVADVAEFLDALRRVAAGGTALDPEVVSQLLVRRGDPLDDLTERERDVMALMAEGRSNAEIGAALVITDSAVSKHINSIFAKLGLYPRGGCSRSCATSARARPDPSADPGPCVRDGAFGTLGRGGPVSAGTGEGHCGGAAVLDERDGVRHGGGLVAGRAVGQHPQGGAGEVVGHADEGLRLVAVGQRLQDPGVFHVPGGLPAVRVRHLVDADVADRPVGQRLQLPLQ